MLLISLSAVATAADVRGVVIDARGGEALARVRVQLPGTAHQTATDNKGRFFIDSIEAGNYTLQVETVGYRLLKRDFELAVDESKDFQVILSPDAFRRTDTISVKADPFDITQSATPSELNLSDTEIKNLGSVLLDDPVRAVQSLPGVVANNDYYSQFSIYGAPYNNIGLYLDDILLHAPFHTISDVSGGGSVSILNGDSTESLSLMPLAFPARYSDRTGSALDVHTRDGSRMKPSIRAAASVAQVNVLAEGPIGKSKHGSWLASARKSYMQYLVTRLTDDPAQAFGYIDEQGKATYDLTSKHSVTLQASDAQTHYDRSSTREKAGINTLVFGNYHVSLARAAWRYVPDPKILISASVSYMRERTDNVNKDSRPLGQAYYGEWIGNANATWNWSDRNPLELGYSVRRLRTDGFDLQYVNTSSNSRVRDTYRGTALRQGGYAQQSWNGLHNRLRLAAGLRWDHHEDFDSTPVSPHASLGLGLTKSMQLQFGWGQYLQYPELQLLNSTAGGKYLLPERSNHYVASVERRLSRIMRLRVEAYQRENRDVLARPFLDPRLVDGKVVFGPPNPLYTNSVRGYSRGVQIMVQSRSANRLSGWASYTLGYSRNRDGLEHTSYWSNEDQRHTVNLFTSYRIRPSFNISGKWALGSSTPLPGFFRKETNGLYYIAPARNEIRLSDYQRLDLRVNKSLVFDRWKLTLYGELINATNHKNYRLSSYNSADSRTGRASISIDRVFPILPSGGIMLEF